MKRLLVLITAGCLMATVLSVGSPVADAQGTAPTSCWRFTTGLESTNAAYNGVVGPQAAGAGTNDAQVTSANPSPAGGSSLLLDGNGDYLEVGKPLPTTGSYTKTMWVRRAGPNIDGAWEILYSSGDPGGPHAMAIDPDNDQKLLVWHRNGTGPGISGADTGQSIPTGQWVHVATVYDAAADAIITYYNGTAVNTQSPVGTLGTMTEADNIGAYAAMQSWFNGQLDDICVYPAALSSTEISALAGNAATTSCVVVAPGGAIPDGDPLGGLQLVMPIAHSATIASLELVLNGLTHPNVGDLTMILQSPDPGLFVSVMNQPNDEDTSNVDGTYTFSDAGSSFFDAAEAVGDAEIVPPGTYWASRSDTDQEDLDDQFIGLSTMGTWSVQISDNTAGNTGSVTSFMLRFEVTSGGCPPQNVFADVAPAQYYADAVTWAASAGVTTGTSATTFAPNATVNRAQMATFLWRFAGRAAPTAPNPFGDVAPGQYYTDAVAWLAEQGITTGTTATTFSPNAALTRAQMATFLWRYEGSPAPTAANPFVDVTAGQYYTDAVTWLAERGITTGTTATTFSPNAALTRGQMATFLWRYAGRPSL